MSGGSFNYAYLLAQEAAESFAPLWQGEYERMEDYLRTLSMNDAADEIHRYATWLELMKAQIEAEGKRMADLLQSVEWECSGDWSQKSITNAMEALSPRADIVDEVTALEPQVADYIHVAIRRAYIAGHDNAIARVTEIIGKTNS